MSKVWLDVAAEELFSPEQLYTNAVQAISLNARHVSWSGTMRSDVKLIRHEHSNSAPALAGIVLHVVLWSSITR